MNNVQSVLISCHVAKTGGTSFRAMLASVHGDRLVLIARMPNAQPIRRELYPLLRWNYWYARSIDSHDLRYTPPEQFWPGARFSIILRDPVERFLSSYFFFRYHTGRSLRASNQEQTESWLENNFPSVEVYLESENEYQTKFVGCASFFRPASKETFVDACGLLERYDYIGFCECTDKFPAIIAADFPELMRAAMPTENVTPKSGNGLWRNRIEQKLLDTIRSRFTFDFRLYDAAIKLNRRRGHPVP
jgi:Sulfotransferase family